MSKYFSIDGYWKDSKEKFSGLVVKEFDELDNDDTDEFIFFYGLGEHDLKEAIELKEDTVHDFVVTDYEEIKD